MEPYHAFVRRAPPEARPLLDQIRGHCLGMGDSVVEDVRAHRVVYGKSMIYRWFADVEPRADRLVLRTQRSRREGPHTMEMPYGGDASRVLDRIRDAFDALV